MTADVEYVVEVFNGKKWAKVRGDEGGPWNTRDRAERIARAREDAERRPSSTEGLPHRVTERTTPFPRSGAEAQRMGMVEEYAERMATTLGRPEVKDQIVARWSDEEGAK